MRRIHIRLLEFSVLFASLCTQAYPAIFERDDRQYVSTAPGSPYSPIGLVQKSGLLTNKRTTGILVDKCHVLTSQHIFGMTSSPVGKRLRFEGVVGSRQQISSSGTVVAAGGLEQLGAAAGRADGRGRDWLLLRLDKCLGTTLGYARLRVGPFTTADFRNLESAGFPSDRSNGAGLSIDPACAITGRRGTAWLNDCATLPGNSGGPIFRIANAAGAPQLQVYAIQTAGFTWRTAVPFTPGYENEATPITLIASQIEPYLLNAPALASDDDVSGPKQVDAIPRVSGSAGVPSYRHLLDARLDPADP